MVVLVRYFDPNGRLWLTSLASRHHWGGGSISAPLGWCRKGKL